MSIIDSEAVEHFSDFHFILIGESLTAVEILVSRDLAIDHEAEDKAEKILLTIDYILGIIKRSILGDIEVELAINLAHIRDIGIMRLLGGIEILHTLRDLTLTGSTFLITLGAFADATGIFYLSHTGNGASGNSSEQKNFTK